MAKRKAIVMNSDGSKNSIPASDYIEVPLGGSSGQILAKNSATDHDLTWVAIGANEVRKARVRLTNGIDPYEGTFIGTTHDGIVLANGDEVFIQQDVSGDGGVYIVGSTLELTYQPALVEIGFGTANKGKVFSYVQGEAFSYKDLGDPWTYIKLASEFTTTVIPVSDIGLAFTPAANTTYEFEAQILVRAASTATGARVGLAWNTGNTDGAAMITSPNAGNGFATSIGGTNASLLAAATGMPTNTNSALATIKGTVIVGASPSGDIKIQLASEVAASWVSARVGSFLKYRVLP